MSAISSPEAVRRGTRLLAGTGVALLAVAAISLGAARWDQFGPGARLTILMTVSAVVFAATQALRRVAPETTRALDVLVATLIPVDVAALVIVSGATWRAALVAAGPAAVVASEALRRRDSTFVTELGTVVGGVLTVCGLAALYDVPAPLLLGGLGLIAVAVAPAGPDRWFGAGWALLAGLTPALRVLDDAVFTGMGTLREMGLLDAADPWETATSGALATTALVIVAVRRRSPVAALGALATTAATGLQIWGELDPPRTVGLIAAAVVLVLVELGLTLPAARSRQAASSLAGDVTTAGGGMLTMVVAAVAWVALTGDEMPGSHFQYTAAVLAVFWLVGDLRRAAEQRTSGAELYLVGGRWDPALPGFAAATASAVHLGIEPDAVLGLVLAALGLLAVTTRRPARLATAGLAFAAAPFVVGPDLVSMVVAGLSVWGLSLLALQVADRDDAGGTGVIGVVGAIAVVTAVPGALAAHSAWGLYAAGVYWLIVLWVAARIVDTLVPGLAGAYRMTAQLGLLVVALDDFALAAALAAAATAVHELEYRERASGLHRGLAAATAVLAWWFGATAAGIDVIELYLLPPLWLSSVVLDRLGLDRTVAIGLAGTGTVVLTVLGRLHDGRPVHTLVLGTSALALAMWAAVGGNRLALAAGGSVAVATAVFEGLDRSMGIETWGWMVVGGMAAITAAGLLEVHQRTRPTVGDTTSTDDVFVS